MAARQPSSRKAATALEAPTSRSTPRLLVVDDEPTVVLSLTTFFQQQGFEVEACAGGTEALVLLSRTSFDVVLLDLLLQDPSGMDILREIKERYPEVAVVIMSGAGTVEAAVQAVKAGAEDFFKKPFGLEEAALVLRRTLELRQLEKQNRYYMNVVQGRLQQEVLGLSPAMERLRALVDLMAENPDTTLLIEGESGVGKGLVARAIHATSPRKRGAFVEINCASLSESLLESELFGYEKGAFTGAFSRKQGLLEVADGGTLFLDEVSDLPLAVQPRLLTAMESHSFRRLGGTRDLRTNVRIIACTNRPLRRVVAEGKFREDLSYRLRVMCIEIPPLREHKEDIPLLTERFLAEFSSRGFGMKRPPRISDAASAQLLAYDWPGNVRELRNVIERAVILSRGELIGLDHLPHELARGAPSGPPTGDGSIIRTLEEVEIAHIREVLRTTGFNHSRAARLLGLHRTTLLDKIKKHRLEP
jgi:DNA-binding NtrC family response regulator